MSDAFEKRSKKEALTVLVSAYRIFTLIPKLLHMFCKRQIVRLLINERR